MISYCKCVEKISISKKIKKIKKKRRGQAAPTVDNSGFLVLKPLLIVANCRAIPGAATCRRNAQGAQFICNRGIGST
jgi:hypothetical protein